VCAFATKYDGADAFMHKLSPLPRFQNFWIRQSYNRTTSTKHARHKFTHVLTSLTNCFAEYAWAANIVYGALVVTLAMLLRLINCRFFIIIIIIIITVAAAAVKG